MKSAPHVGWGLTQAAWLVTGLVLSALLGSGGAALTLAALAGDLWLGPQWRPSDQAAEAGRCGHPSDGRLQTVP